MIENKKIEKHFELGMEKITLLFDFVFIYISRKNVSNKMFFYVNIKIKYFYF